MAKATMKKMRPPPATTDLKEWISTGKTDADLLSSTESLTTQVTDNPVTQVTGSPTPQVAGSPGARPAGKGIVERADGSYRRRLVVYVEPERALKLKSTAARQGRDMSDIIDGLLQQWLDANPA